MRGIKQEHAPNWEGILGRDPDLGGTVNIISSLGILVEPTVFRFSFHGTFVKLSTLRMAFPLLSTYARRSLVAIDWSTQIASPCAAFSVIRRSDTGRNSRSLGCRNIRRSPSHRKTFVLPMRERDCSPRVHLELPTALRLQALLQQQQTPSSSSRGGWVVVENQLGCVDDYEQGRWGRVQTGKNGGGLGQPQVNGQGSWIFLGSRSLRV